MALMTQEEKETLVDKIEDLIKNESMSVTAAAERCGVNWHKYYSMINSLGRRPVKAKGYKISHPTPVLHRAVIHEIFSQQGETKGTNEGPRNAVHEEAPMVILVGRESSVNEALKNLASLWR